MNTMLGSSSQNEAFDTVPDAVANDEKVPNILETEAANDVNEILEELKTRDYREDAPWYGA